MLNAVQLSSMNFFVNIFIALHDEVEQVGEGRFPAPPLRLRVEGGGGEGGEGPVPRHDEGPVLAQVSRAGQVTETDLDDPDCS